jgi:hypothetical protein
VNEVEMKEMKSEVSLSEIKLADLKSIAKSFDGYPNAMVKKICMEIIKKIDWAEVKYQEDAQKKQAGAAGDHNINVAAY